MSLIILFAISFVFVLIVLAPLTLFHRVMRLWKLMVIIACVGLLFISFIPNSPRCVKSSGRERHCIYNIRLLTGAIEMYDMDHEKPFRELTETSMEELIREQYLKSFTKDEECEYKSKGELDFDKKDSGFIYCTYHGDIDGYLECKYHQNDKKRIPQNCSIERYYTAKKESIKREERAFFIEKCKAGILIVIIVILYGSCFFDKEEPKTNL
jgi:competence protein ComGC